MTKAEFTSSSSSHSLRLMWHVETKSGARGRWTKVSTHATSTDAADAASVLKRQGFTVRVRGGL